MFCNFRNSMALCVMVFILIGGCAAKGQTVEMVNGNRRQSGSSVLTDGSDESPGRKEKPVSAADFENENENSGTGRRTESSYADKAADSERREPAETITGVIYVDVCGAVNSPGVVSLAEGSRVFEAIDRAGGLRSDADERFINKARILSDGEQIYVPTREETEGQSPQFAGSSPGTFPGEGIPGNASDYDGNRQPGGAADPGIDAEGKVNINTADSETLQTLSGIGQSRAEAIILYRETNGAFESIEDIMKVNGIKNALFNNIKNDITVG